MITNRLWIFFILLFLSCNKTFDSRQKFVEYIVEKDNGYRYTKNINGTEFSLQYRPTDILVNHDLNHDDNVEIENVRKKYKKFLYFNLTISRNNKEVLNEIGGEKSQFGEMINQLAFAMNENVHLVTSGRDTIKIVDFNYPRMYGLSGNTSILIAYPRTTEILEDEYFNIIIKDFGLYTGDINFKIATQPIKNEPELNI